MEFAIKMVADSPILVFLHEEPAVAFPIASNLFLMVDARAYNLLVFLLVA